MMGAGGFGGPNAYMTGMPGMGGPGFGGPGMFATNAMNPMMGGGFPGMGGMGGMGGPYATSMPGSMGGYGSLSGAAPF
jgi:hypothetical protein